MNTQHEWKPVSEGFLQLVLLLLLSGCFYMQLFKSLNRRKTNASFTLAFLFLHFYDTQGFYEDLQDLLELTPTKDVIFIIGDWDPKVATQKIPGVIGKFGLGV